MRVGALIVALAAAALTGVAARSAPSGPPTVTCDKIIDTVGSAHARTDRIVLGAVSIRAYLPQVVATRTRPWTYWSKVGLVIRGGTPAVSINVHGAWRKRAAITWGNTDIVGALRVASCPSYGSKTWNAYAGGFYLRSPSACVPLVFGIGKRSATVRFGVGRACPR
jgi:hypothetical protein